MKTKYTVEQLREMHKEVLIDMLLKKQNKSPEKRVRKAFSHALSNLATKIGE